MDEVEEERPVESAGLRDKFRLAMMDVVDDDVNTSSSSSWSEEEEAGSLHFFTSSSFSSSMLPLRLWLLIVLLLLLLFAAVEVVTLGLSWPFSRKPLANGLLSIFNCVMRSFWYAVTPRKLFYKRNKS